jgi:hypothetical protein
MNSPATPYLPERWTPVLAGIARRISLGDIFLFEIVLLGTFPTVLKADLLDKHAVIKMCYLLRVHWEF